MCSWGVMYQRAPESTPRSVPATFHWLHRMTSENNHSLQKITAENNTHKAFLLCILWTWGCGTTLLLPQPAWAYLGGLPYTEWHRVPFRGLNLCLQNLCRNSWRGIEERGSRFPQDGSLFGLISWPASQKYLSFKSHHCKVKLPFVAPSKFRNS